MGNVLNPIIGGGGGLAASIFVKGLSQTDTVSCLTPSGTTKQGVWTSKTVEGATVYGWLFDKLKDFGMYTVSATYGSKTATQEVLVDVATEYEITMSFVTIMGISRDITNSSPAWTRTDASVGKTATASVGSTAGHSDFDTMPIYSSIARETLSTGDVMVKIPKFWFNRYRDANMEYIQIADAPVDGFALHPAFSRGSNTHDYIYVGAYKTSSNNRSLSNASPTVSQTRASFRSDAKNKGTGWGIIDISAISAIQMLIMVEFATNDVQSAIGRGCCDKTASGPKINTGSCDSVPNLTGRPSGTAGLVDVAWRGIEGFWGNIWEWTDGLNWNGGTYYYSNIPANYADNTSNNYTALSYKGSTSWSGSYITREGLDTSNPAIMMPSEAGSGSDSAHFCDGIWSSTGWRVFARGGPWLDGSLVGLFASVVTDASSGTDMGHGSRLQYLP